MADQTYPYSISEDFPNQAVSPDKLKGEIDASAIETGCRSVNVAGDDCVVIMKGTLSAGDLTLLNSLVAVHDGVPPDDVDGLLVTVANDELAVDVQSKVVTDLRSDSRVDLFSINLCDKCTWYPESVAVLLETLTTSDNMTFGSAHQYWIDLYHGRLSDEDDLASNYPIVVTVNDIPVNMDTPFGSGGDGDYSLDPESGEITFHEALDPADVVKASYHYATTSVWTIIPAAGKQLELLKAECQLSKGIDMLDTIQYEVFILGQYVGGPPGVPVAIRTKKYKNVKDFINESNGAYPEVPAFGGSTRGIADPVLIFPWLYLAKTQLLSELGMFIKVRLANDQVCAGELAVVTFYCVSINA